MGVVKLSFLLILYTALVALILMCVPGLPPDMKLEPYEVPPAAKLEGKLAPNGKLDRAELVFDGDYIGPESIAFRNDEVYTGVNGGYILRIKNGKTEKVVQTGKPCAGHWEIEICGRPLGLRFEPSGKLIVADATQGLLRVDVDKKTVETILPRYAKIGGSDLPLNFADDVDVSKDGVIYFSDVGKFGTYGDIFADLVGEPTGRLIKYDPKTKKTEVLISGLRFANGVQLSRKEDFVVVCETGLSRVWKYYLSGTKAGKKEVLIGNLPGYPDNVRTNGKGGFYVSLVFSRKHGEPAFLDQVAPHAWARKILLRFQRIVVKLFETVNSYAPHEYVGRAISYAKEFGPLGSSSAFSKNVVIVEVDENGNVLGSLQNQKGKISFISEIGVGEKFTYFGSPFTPQLWRIKTAEL